MTLIDRRVKRTYRLLTDALISLSNERGYDNVSIRDITERADIAYSTFFRHYPDKDALLEAMIGEAVNTLIELIKSLSNHTPFEVGRLIFEHVNTHDAFYRVLLSSQGLNPVLASVQARVQQLLIDRYSREKQTAFPLEIVSNHIVTAILALIKWWLDHDKSYPVDEMARIYADLIIKPIERATFGETAKD